MLLQLRVQNSQNFVEGETYTFRGNIIRLSWEADGRLVAGRLKRPLLIFYQQETGCRVRCVPTEAVKLNGLPLEKEQRLNLGDQMERPDGWSLTVSTLQTQDEQEAVFVVSNPGARTKQIPDAVPRILIAMATCAVILGVTLGSIWNSSAIQSSYRPNKDLPSPNALADRTVRDAALELKEILSQVSESRDVSTEELLTTLASARRITQQLARLHSEDGLAITVATAVNSFYQLSQGIVAEDPVSYQAALESAKRCLSATNINRQDELIVFYRALAGISQREAQNRLPN
ncbi:MAG: hypothetical protein H7Y37_06515 [Anaerolineae bacterium]|nr:hypothetical protein [Gloeobacterales cyanobacterium ES-bin-313]